MFLKWNYCLERQGTVRHFVRITLRRLVTPWFSQFLLIKKKPAIFVVVKIIKQWTLQHEHCGRNSQWIKRRSHQLACLYYYICRHCSELSANSETLKSRYKIFFLALQLQINVFSALFLATDLLQAWQYHCYHPLARRRMKTLFMQHQ